jgi:hypothetical protein
MFMLVANLVSSFIMNAQTSDGDFIFPGVEYHRELNDTGDIDEYEEELNATEIMKELQPPTGAFEYVIHQFTVVFTFVAKIRWLFDGFPQMLEWYASYIAAYQSISIFLQFGNILRAINVVMLFTLALEILRGYQILP